MGTSPASVEPISLPVSFEPTSVPASVEPISVPVSVEPISVPASFEPSWEGTFPDTLRSPPPSGASGGEAGGTQRAKGPHDRKADARRPMVLRLEDTTVAEALALIPGLRASVAVTVEGGEAGENERFAGARLARGRETFLFWRGRLVGPLEVAARLRDLGKGPGLVRVTMRAAEEITELFEDMPSVMEILLRPAERRP